MLAVRIRNVGEGQFEIRKASTRSSGDCGGKRGILSDSPQSVRARAEHDLLSGGTIENGETAEQAVVRELQEELSLTVTNPRMIWHSRTSWGTLLDWLVVDRDANSPPIANEREVAEFLWVKAEQLLKRHDLLGSMPDFFGAWASGVFELPERAGHPLATWTRFVRRD